MNCECVSRSMIIFGVLLALVGAFFSYMFSPSNAVIDSRQSMSQYRVSSAITHDVAYEYRKRQTISVVFAALGVIVFSLGFAKKRSSDCAKKCPDCKKLVKPKAKSCRHCTSIFTDT